MSAADVATRVIHARKADGWIVYVYAAILAEIVLFAHLFVFGRPPAVPTADLVAQLLGIISLGLALFATPIVVVSWPETAGSAARDRVWGTWRAVLQMATIPLVIVAFVGTLLGSLVVRDTAVFAWFPVLLVGGLVVASLWTGVVIAVVARARTVSRALLHAALFSVAMTLVLGLPTVAQALDRDDDFPRFGAEPPASAVAGLLAPSSVIHNVISVAVEDDHVMDRFAWRIFDLPWLWVGALVLWLVVPMWLALRLTPVPPAALPPSAPNSEVLS